MGMMDMMRMMNGMPNNNMMGGGFYGWPLAELLGLALAALLIVGFVYLIKALLGGQVTGKGAGATNGALEELKLRYARGEIDRSEYQQKKYDILAA